MLPAKTDVLIVGAGPTGLALAVALRQAGVDHVLIEALPEAQALSRAAVIHAHTLEALGSTGVVETLRRDGLELSSFTVRDRDRPLLEIGFDGLPCAIRGLLMVPQSVTERRLAERLEALGGRIHRNVAAISARRREGGASVRLRTPAGERTVEARYVVGGDGMNSLVRKAAGIGFEGQAYGQSFVLADIRMAWPLQACEVSLFFSPGGLMVVAPLRDGIFRIVATVDEAREAPSAADVQRLLDARGPSGGGARVEELVWGSRFRVHHRLADTYREGPFLLMGDSAHVHSPAGGQGMNTGLVDSVVLAEALARVLRAGAPDSLLDLYSATRREAARGVLALAARLTGLATLRPAPLRGLRNLLLRLLNRSGRFKRKLALDLSGISRRHLARLPGEPAPPVPSATAAPEWARAEAA
ncbi:MAG TPA: FAD-dependent monooxygenase [Allosphingosinicella sp.]|nr:FAD-dependent monooxygenase [Allosphingosinicella sp.]